MPLVAEDRIIRTGLVAVVGAVVATFLLATVGDPWRTGVAAALVVLLVAVGSPHGALDHLVLVNGARVQDAGSTPGGRVRRMVRAARAQVDGLGPGLVVGYAGLALLSLLCYLAAPQAGFALFLVLSVAHFAAGEAGVAVDRGLARGWLDPLAWVAALGGVVVVVLPLASRGAAAAVEAVDPRLTPVLATLVGLRPVVVLAAALAVLGCLVAAQRGSSRAPVVAVELMALTAVSLLADPLLAFGAYFAFWHSLRHQARLAQLLRGPGGRPAPTRI
uniref:Brp/Blh family beta-carotene 15,15'-dioxygenase n=1 Tax=Aquipuribacter hungaricus TaxID=545624 RepID=UPI0030ED2FAB